MLPRSASHPILFTQS